MTKKLILLVVILIVSLIPFASFAAEDSGTYKDISWSLDKRGTLTLEDGDSISAEGPWLKYNKNIVNIIIGDSFKTIERNAYTELQV